MASSNPKTLEEILSSKKFGNLSIIVPLMILIVGVIITISAFFVGGGTHEAGTRSIELLATVVVLATTGSLTSYGFKSQTKIDLQNYMDNLDTVDIATEDGFNIKSLSTYDNDIKGNFGNNQTKEESKIAVSNEYETDLGIDNSSDDIVNRMIVSENK